MKQIAHLTADGSGAEAASEASEAGESSVGLPENEAEREQIRRELLLGHLLTLAASGGNAAVPPHALPAVASMLQAQGLLPKWVGWTLTQQPALFDRAFQRLFAQVGAMRMSLHDVLWGNGVLILGQGRPCMLQCVRAGAGKLSGGVHARVMTAWQGLAGHACQPECAMCPRPNP